MPLAAVLLAGAGAAAWSNSFACPFIFDDVPTIQENPHVERLWPLDEAMSAPADTTASGRPLVSLSLAMNYAISGRDVWSYHALNLAVHVLAGLTLFGIVRRALLASAATETRLAGHSGLPTRGPDQTGKQADWLALAVALIWLVHPLQTQAVTYVVQRAESMMGLFYLLTVYLAARGMAPLPSPASPRGAPARQGDAVASLAAWPWPGGWMALSVLACAAGMAAKETMATAPLMVLLYDRTFAAGSFRQAIAGRWRLYTGLAATWLILAALVAGQPRETSAGFGLATFTPLGYALTQGGVILHYLHLAFWPSPLVLDYHWPAATAPSQWAPQAAAVLALLAATVAAMRLRPVLGFIGAWFFLILAPTSTFVPIADPIFEHRMYLPLAAIVAAAVGGSWLAGRRLVRRALLLGVASLAAIVILLGWLTHSRNHDYRSAVAIWTDTAAKQPASPRAYMQLGAAYRAQDQYDQAIACYDKSLALDAGYAKAYLGRGIALACKEQYDLAMGDLDKAVSLAPGYYLSYANRAILRLELGQYEPAIADFRRAAELNPTDSWVRQGLREAQAAASRPARP